MRQSRVYSIHFTLLHASSTHLDLLAKTKAQLDDSNAANRASLIQNLHQVALLAESFAEQRPRSNTDWIKLADMLDQEGWSSFAYQIAVTRSQVSIFGIFPELLANTRTMMAALWSEHVSSLNCRNTLHTSIKSDSRLSV